MKKQDKLAARVLQGLNDALDHAKGNAAAAIVHVPVTVDVKSIRLAQGLSQTQFAGRYGFTAAAVRDWEQGRRQPERAARVLLKIIDQEPDAVDRALHANQLGSPAAISRARKAERESV